MHRAVKNLIAYLLQFCTLRDQGLFEGAILLKNQWILQWHSLVRTLFTLYRMAFRVSTKSYSVNTALERPNDKHELHVRKRPLLNTFILQKLNCQTGNFHCNFSCQNFFLHTKGSGNTILAAWNTEMGFKQLLTNDCKRQKN